MSKTLDQLDWDKIEPLDWDFVSGRVDHNGEPDPRQRYRLYRLCNDEPDPELVACVASPAAAGVALVELGREGEWDDCPVGLLDTFGEPGKRWIFRPWLPNAMNVKEAGRMLRTARQDVEDMKPVAAKCPACQTRTRLTKDGRIFKHRTNVNLDYCAASGSVHPIYLKGM